MIRAPGPSSPGDVLSWLRPDGGWSASLADGRHLHRRRTLGLLESCPRAVRLSAFLYVIAELRAMSADLTFAMGKYEARIPADRLYSENHQWLLEAPGGFRVGLTAFSVRLLQDVYFLEWTIDPRTRIRRKQEIGEIESSKAVSALFGPADGRVLDFNERLLDDPTPINTDSYDTGWLYTFETEARLLTPAQYIELLDANWDDTQRMIKGQMN